MKTRILFVSMSLMGMVLIASAQKPTTPPMGKKMPPAHAMTKGKKLGLKKALPMRDPKTGRFMKKPMPMRDPKTGRFIKKDSLPMRDPKTGRFISTHKKTMGTKSMGKKPSMKKG